MVKKLFITQLFCILLVIFGAGIEFLYHADIGFLAITIGSLLFSLTTKFENYHIEKRKKKHYINQYLKNH